MFKSLRNNRAGQAILGFFTDLGGSSLLIVAGFVTAPIILRLTSEVVYGFWITTLSVLGYLAITDMGLGLSLTRLIAGLSDNQDKLPVNRLISTAFFIFCGAGLILFSIGMVFSPLLASWFKIPVDEAAQVIPAYQVAVISTAISLPLSTFSAILTGYQRMAVDNTIRNVIALTGIAVSLWLLFAGWGIMSLAVSSLFTVLTTSLINYLYIRSLCPWLKVAISYFNLEDMKKLLSFGGYFQLGRIANIVALSTDSIVIATFKGASMVTPYAFTSKLAILFSVNIASKLPVAVFPALAQMFTCNEIDKLRKVYLELAIYATRLAIIAGAFLLIANQKFVSLWVGESYFGGTLLNLVFVYWILQDTIYRGTAVVALASGDLRNWSFACMIESIVNIVASILLVGPFGLVGVALGTSIGKTITTAWYIPYWICKKIELPVRQLLWKGIFYTFLQSLPGVLFSIYLASVIPNNWNWLWVFMVGCVIVVLNAVSFEGIIWVRSSNLPFRERIQQLIPFGIGVV